MDAIVSGKVEKPEGSLGVFKVNNNYKFVSTYDEILISESDYNTHFLKIVDKLQSIILIAINHLPSYSNTVTVPAFFLHDGNASGYGDAGYGTAISCYYSYNGWHLAFKLNNTLSDINNCISSLEIGTLETT